MFFTIGIISVIILVIHYIFGIHLSLFILILGIISILAGATVGFFVLKSQGKEMADLDVVVKVNKVEGAESESDIASGSSTISVSFRKKKFKGKKTKSCK